MKKNIHQRLAHILLITALCSGALIISNRSASGEDSGFTMPPDSQKTSNITERLQKRKTDARLKLAEETKKRVADRCQTAQDKIGPLKTKDDQVREKRFARYNGILKKVSTIIGRLNQQGLSTAELQTALTQYEAAVNQYLADAEQHKTAIADLVAMACDKDTEGFSATLQSARTARGVLLKDSVEIRAAIAQLKQELADAKQALREAGGASN